jgi:8-oxo-dGTP diphosphatase
VTPSGTSPLTAHAGTVVAVPAKPQNRACPDGAARAVTVKAVCLTEDGRVLLCRNHRGEWELPGGRPHPGERHEDCAIREVREETGLDVTVDRFLGVQPFEVTPGAWVDVVAYDCVLPAGAEQRALTASGEHTQVAFHDPRGLRDSELPRAYKHLIALHQPPGSPNE